MPVEQNFALMDPITIYYAMWHDGIKMLLMSSFKTTLSENRAWLCSFEFLKNEPQKHTKPCSALDHENYRLWFSTQRETSSERRICKTFFRSKRTVQSSSLFENIFAT